MPNKQANVALGGTGRACVVVAYTDNGKDVQIFQGKQQHSFSNVNMNLGELEGKVVPPRGDSGLGWEYPIQIIVFNSLFDLLLVVFGYLTDTHIH